MLSAHMHNLYTQLATAPAMWHAAVLLALGLAWAPGHAAAVDSAATTSTAVSLSGGAMAGDPSLKAVLVSHGLPVTWHRLLRARS